MPQAAVGLPNPERYGDTSKLPIKQLLDYVVQRHEAERAKLHYDLRLGNKDLGMLSWAVRKGMPTPGGKHLAVEQPVHSHDYKDFQGRIESGYGKGDVSTHDKGEVLVTKAGPNNVSFTVAHKGVPERYVLTRTGYGRDGRGWLLMNVTPTKPVDAEKKRYVPVSPEKAESIIQNLQPGESVSPKVDGAANLYKLLKDKIEVVSFRTSKKTGGPIIHTERAGLYPTEYQKPLPKELEGTTLRGELYGLNKDNRAIPPQELGGLLNSSIANSLRQQQTKGIDLKTMLYDIDNRGKQKVDAPYLDRHKMLSDLMSYLPKDRFHVADQATTPQAGMNLWNQVKSHNHPLSQEGVVINRPNKDPMKAKLFDDFDVVIRNIFPGEGKYKNLGAGGFEYSHTPEGPISGKVGTGFVDDVRKNMWANPNNYIGRTAKVTSQEKLPSGALRAPAFWALHEDKQAAYYHGSDKDIDVLEPRPGHPVGGEPVVFGTPDRGMAISNIPKWKDSDFEQGRINDEPFYMKEQYPGAFDKLFTKAKGKLYTLPEEGFSKDPRLMPSEVISRQPVKPIAKEEIKDVIAELLKAKWNLIQHDGKPYRLPIKQAAVYVGPDAHHKPEEVQGMLNTASKNLGIETPKDVDVLHGASQPVRDVVRYFSPKYSGGWMKSLKNVAKLPLPRSMLNDDEVNLRELINNSGDRAGHGGGYFDKAFKTIHLPEHKINPLTLGHELGHYLEYKGKDVFKNHKHPLSPPEEVEPDINEELKSWMVARKAFGDNQWNSTRNDAVPAFASYLKMIMPDYKREAKEYPATGRTPKEVEQQRPASPDKNWKANITNKWHTATPEERDRMIRRALSFELPPNKYDPYAYYLKDITRPDKYVVTKWMDPETKGLPNLAKLMLDLEYKRLNPKK